MARLTRLLEARRVTETPYDDSNLSRGKIFTFTPGTMNHGMFDGFCWKAPAQGTAIIEVWGAGGSGGLMCCCGASLPGNPGAYSKKTIEIDPSGYISGCAALSCGNNALCFRGCSSASGVCWYQNETTNGCMCAQGGRGGWAFCTEACSPYTRFVNCCFAGTQTDTGCGIVCNYTNYATAGFNEVDWMAKGFGGDVNKDGGFSCTTFNHCNSCCICCIRNHVSMPAGVFSEESSQVEVVADLTDAARTQWAITPFMQGLSGLSKSPTEGMSYSYCWNGSVACGCYEAVGCHAWVGHGTPGLSAMPCAGVRDHAIRGGHGAVRIQFIEKSQD
jgi:hypothetical protein